MGSRDLSGFWMSIIGDSSIQEQLMSTMRMKDVEERALTLLTRTLFLIIMEIKCERDEAMRTSEGIMEVVDGCDSCKTKVVVREPANRTTANYDLPLTETQTPKDGCEERDSHAGKFDEAGSSVSHKENKHTPPKEEEEEEEEEEKEETPSITQVSEEVLVPGTLDMESCFPETQQQRDLATQRRFVAETLDIDDCNTHNTSDVFEDGEDRSTPDTQLTLKPVFKASSHTLDSTQHTQHTLRPSGHHTPTKWRSPTRRLKGKASAPRRRESRYLEMPESNLRHSPYKAQQKETEANHALQNNSCSDISKHRNKAKGGYAKEEEEEEEEYTEDIPVESDVAFRTPRKFTVISPHKFMTPTRTPSDSRTPKSGCQSIKKSPEGSPVFRRGRRQGRNPPPLSPSQSPNTEAKRDISQAFDVPQKRVEVTGKKEMPERGKGSPRGSRQHEGNHPSLPSQAEKGKGSPIGRKQHKGNHLSLPSQAEKGKESPKGSRTHGSHLALPSPLPSPHNVSDELTSPSILPPLGVIPRVRTMPPPPCPTRAQQRHSERGEADRTNRDKTGGGGEETEEIRAGGEPEGIKIRGGVPLTKSASSLNAFTSARKLSLRRHQTTDVKRTGAAAAGRSGSRLQLSVSPPEPQRRKTGYRQTTVYNYLSPQAAAARPGGSGERRVFVDDDEALRLAMEESLQLKALADMGRELDQREQEGSEATSSAHQLSKESPIKLPNLRLGLTSPKQASRSPRAANNSPRINRNSPKPAQMGSKFTHRSSDVKSSARRRIIAGDKEEEEQGRGVKGKMKEDKDKGREQRGAEVEEREEREGVRSLMTNKKPGDSGLKRKLEEEEEEALPSAQEEGKARPGNESKENASPRKGGTRGQGKPPAKRSNRQEAFQNSFDILPQKEEPSFAHIGEVVRKKADRRQLEGWSCKQCKEFYEKAGSSTQEVKELMNKCSRHRSKHKPLSNTPEGFWNPFFDD